MAKAPATDRQLIERVKQGDKRAFDLLVLKYQHKIQALVSSYIKDAHEIQDVTQEAFIKAYRALANFRGDSAFYTWLYRIAINTAKNYLVSRGRKTPSVDIDIEDAVHFEEGSLRDFGTPESLLHKEEIEKVIYDVIECLPDGLKTALTLRELEGLTYEEISEIMGCPVGTVRSRIFRAREAIDKVLCPLLMKDD